MTDKDRLAWELGWDFALFSWPIPDDANAAFRDGYRAFQHGGKRPTKKNQSIYDKKWLQLRVNAWRRGKYFDSAVTPAFLETLMPLDKCCPVTQRPFTFATQEDTDWSVERGNNDEDYIPRNLIVISVRANAAKSNLSFKRIQQFADGSLVNDRLSAREWQRLAELVEPMHELPGLRGVMYLEGQKVATGVAMSPLAEFQKVLASVAIEEARGYNRQGCALMIHALLTSICRSKSEIRAFKQLLIAVRQRARHVQYADRLWATPRVHKKLEAFGLVLGRGDGDSAMRRLTKGLIEAGERLDGLMSTDRGGPPTGYPPAVRQA
jgi:hypothetical protein